MFKFIFFNVFEIFVVTACILIVGVLVFATRYRLKQDVAERENEGTAKKTSDQKEKRELGVASSDMAQVFESNEQVEAPDQSKKD